MLLNQLDAVILNGLGKKNRFYCLFSRIILEIITRVHHVSGNNELFVVIAPQDKPVRKVVERL